MSALIRFEDVGKRYLLGADPFWALQALDLTIDSGSFVILCGPSGSGKSTLLNLAGLLDTPSQGRILLSDEQVNGLSPARRALLRNHRIGFIFQHFNLVPVLTALENCLLPLAIRGSARRESRQHALSLLDELGLAAHVHKRPDLLSGGQRQRVAIARALVTRPDLIIADEPTANLDSVTAQQIVDRMRMLNRESGVTFLMATHDESLSVGSATRKLRLKDGQIETDEVLS